MVRSRSRPRKTASARLKTCSCRAVRYLDTAPYSTVRPSVPKLLWRGIGSAGQALFASPPEAIQSLQSTLLHIETRCKSVIQSSQSIRLVGCQPGLPEIASSSFDGIPVINSEGDMARANWPEPPAARNGTTGL